MLDTVDYRPYVYDNGIYRYTVCVWQWKEHMLQITYLMCMTMDEIHVLNNLDYNMCLTNVETHFGWGTY